MKVTFLGTGTSQGVPVLVCDCEVCQSIDFRDKRLRTSIHIQTDDDLSVVIDTGPDFRQQMLREKVKKLDAVIFTHQHRDHTAGLDDIRSYFFAQGLEDVPVFASKGVENRLKGEYDYIFAENKYPGVPSVHLEEIIKNQSFEIGETLFDPIEVWHYKMSVFGFRFKDFVYVTDANRIEEDQKEKMKGAKVLVLNALQREAHISHFTLEQALALVEELQPEKAYFTHISHRLGRHSEVEKELPENVFLAYDGLKIEL